MASIYRSHTQFGGALLRAVEGAVRQAFNDHPEWGIKNKRVARSITKRVVGMVGSHWGRLSDLRAKARGAVRLAVDLTTQPATAAGDFLGQSQASVRHPASARRADRASGFERPIRAAEAERLRRRGTTIAHRCIGAMIADTKRAVKDRGADQHDAAIREEALVDAVRTLRRLIDGEVRPSVEWRPLTEDTQRAHGGGGG